MLPSERECREVTDRVLRLARGTDASVQVRWGRESFTRFANNEVTTSGLSDTVNVVVSVTHESRTGRVSLNETSAPALERAAARAKELAAVLPPDPEYVGPLPPQTYLAIPAWDEPTALSTAADRVPGVRAAIEPAAGAQLTSAGFYSTGAFVSAIANTAGVFGCHRATNASFSATVRTADGTGSGWAEESSHRLSDIDPAALAARALAKGRDSAQPRTLEPGDYTVILEPAAVAGLMGFSLGIALSARAAEEGRSYFSKKGGGTLVGEKVFHDRVTLRSDPLDVRNPGAPWAGGGFGGGEPGIATAPVTWIERGVLRTLAYDRYWASKAGVAPTAPPTSIVMDGGTETLDSLIRDTTRGLLVTNFWYIRSVNPQTMQLTGLTRDGVWLIENGAVVGPVRNFRFNESPAVMLSNIEAMTAPARAGSMLVPAVRAANFTFTSVSEAV